MPSWPRSIQVDVPRAVLTLQAGGLLNSFGNGVVLPFLLIYFHNVRGISLGLAGLVVATNAVASLVAGPASGPLVDRLGGKRVLAASLVVFCVGFLLVAVASGPALGSAAMALVGVGNGFFWTAQSTLIAGHTTSWQRPTAFAMQRLVMNLGLGLGALTGGLIATTERPSSFTVIFLLDAATFLAYLAVLVVFVQDVDLGGRRPADRRQGRYADVLRNRAFRGIVLLNALFVFAGMSGFELLPVFAKNETGVSETQIGAIFFVNTLVIVAAQLPIVRAAADRRRMHLLALLGVVWAACWIGVAAVGATVDGLTAAIAFALVMSVFAVGECIHGAVQGPLVSDLAEPALMGRYMALSALSWQVGFALGPAAGGFLLAATPTGTWLVWAALCLTGAGVALVLERTLPAHVLRSPGRRSASSPETETGPAASRDPAAACRARAERDAIATARDEPE